MNIKKIQSIKNPETDPTERLDRMEELANRLINDIKDIKTSHNIKEVSFGKKIGSFEEKMKKLYENINYLRKMNEKEILIKEQEEKYLKSIENDTINANVIIIKEEPKLKVPSKLADFINVGEDIELTKKVIMQKVWQEFQKRNLVYENNKRVLRVDEEVSKLFNIPISVNSVMDHREKNAFTYALLQKQVENLI